MPILLFRTIFAELLRTMLLTTVILVTVIAFGAAVKPLANEQILSASQTLKYIALATVPMLQFALPFAAGFAGTMVYHRLASENELLAIHMAGRSHRWVLLPAIVLGLVVTIGMVGLTQSIIPRFWALMRQTITADVTRQFQTTIDAGRPFVLDDVQIRADRLFVEEAPERSEADTRLWLEGVVAVELADDGTVASDFTAAKATIDLYRREGRTYVKARLIDAVRYDRATGELVSFPDLEPGRPIAVRNALDEDPMFMSRGELLRLRREMDRIEVDVGRHALRLREALLLDQVADAIAARLEADGRLVLDAGRAIPGRTYAIEAATLARSQLRSPGSGPIVVTQFDDGMPSRRFTARGARLEKSPGSTEQWLAAPRMDLELRDLEVADLGPDGWPVTATEDLAGMNRRESLLLPDLDVTEFTDPELRAMASEALLAHVATMDAPSQRIETLRDEVIFRRGIVAAEIEARLQKRYALSSTAVLLMLMGSVLAIIRRDSLPLHIYGLAFIPSIADILLISSGVQMMKDGQALGLLVLWSGHVVLVAGLIAGLRVLGRH